VDLVAVLERAHMETMKPMEEEVEDIRVEEEALPALALVEVVEIL
jgi:hypothetical protein